MEIIQLLIVMKFQENKIPENKEYQVYSKKYSNNVSYSEKVKEHIINLKKGRKDERKK